jgi:aldose 1-epimerase
MQLEPYGVLPDGQVHRVTLTNAHGRRVRILTYGGIIETLEAPDRDGRATSVVLGLPSLTDYVARSPYFGALVGRYANRIAAGRFRIGAQTYQLACNDGPHALHGGVRGFSHRLWQITELAPRALTLSYVSPDGEEGYPGELRVQVRFTWDDTDALTMTASAVSDLATIVNLTSHSYFNLAGDGSGTVLDHTLAIAAARYTPTDATLIPTGDIAAVEGTPFDFRRPTAIGARITLPDPQLAHGLGYDHNWCLDGGMTEAARPVATLRDPESGRTLVVATTEPGLQVYSGNRLDGTLVGLSGRAYPKHGGVALETQHYPDSPNQPAFPSVLLARSVIYRTQTVLRFSAS